MKLVDGKQVGLRLRRSCGVDSHYRIHAATIPLPHGTEPGLAAEIPTGKCQSKAR
jgi:hypothetical protein